SSRFPLLPTPSASQLHNAETEQVPAILKIFGSRRLVKKRKARRKLIAKKIVRGKRNRHLGRESTESAKKLFGWVAVWAVLFTCSRAKLIFASAWVARVIRGVKSGSRKHWH